MTPERVIGLMSGTSLDGVDAALVEFHDGRPRCVATHYQPFPAALRARALQLQSPAADELHDAAVFGNELARLYASTVNALLSTASITAEDVAAIGCHGQTVRHQPQAGYTLQLNNPALLAELTGITVIADFRSRDIAAGGQGAPLVPAFHAKVFGATDSHRTILNLGGIANLTDLNPGRAVHGFDCGPANLLLDAWAQAHIGKAYDADGTWAASGTCLPTLLDRLLAEPFFAAAPPKSCGREDFNLDWLRRFLAGNERTEDVQATLTELTARSVSEAIARWCGVPAALYVCGGGAHNSYLMRRLAALLPQTAVATTDALDLPADWVEAVAFAWLAWRTLHRLPGNLPTVTGAKGPRILGAIYYA